MNDENITNNSEEELSDNIITLTDEEGKESNFELLDLVELDDEEYVVLLPVAEEGEEEEGEVVILKLEDTDEDSDEESYVGVDDEEILNKVFQIFKEKYNIELSIKEPNDIVYNSKKIGGILTESKMSGEIVKYLVVGIGINTNKTKFNKEIKNIATSIKNEFNIEVDNFDFITEFCNRFERIVGGF